MYRSSLGVGAETAAIADLVANGAAGGGEKRDPGERREEEGRRSEREGGGEGGGLSLTERQFDTKTKCRSK